MGMRLNTSVFNVEALREKGMNASNVATRLGVSRECVSKWLKGESMPKPDKLLALGMMLGVTYSQLVIRFGDMVEPIVHFRKKQNRVQDVEDKELTSSIVDFVKHVAKYSSAGEGITISPLKNPKADYDYATTTAKFFRQQLNLPRKIKSKDLVHWFKLFGINLIPAFWGSDEYYGNALRICLSDNSIWVVLNLNSKISDFLFWMAHEIGHSIAPSLEGEAAEKFADYFAEALLGSRLETIKEKNEEKTIAEIVYGTKNLTPKQFVTKSEKWLETSFFCALTGYFTHGIGDNLPISNIAHLFGFSPDDSYGLIKYLMGRS